MSARWSYPLHSLNFSLPGWNVGLHIHIHKIPILTHCATVTGLSTLETFGTDNDAARRAYHTRNHILEFQHAITAPSRCPFPVIVAVHGLAMGLGVDIISACDVRYASDDATFCIKVRSSGPSS